MATLAGVVRQHMRPPMDLRFQDDPKPVDVEAGQIIAAAAEFDNTIPGRYDFKKMTEDAVRGTGAPSDWEQDEAVVQSEEEAAAATARLQQTAAALREGAGVATEVAGATMALKDAGLTSVAA